MTTKAETAKAKAKTSDLDAFKVEPLEAGNAVIDEIEAKVNELIEAHNGAIDSGAK